jgi:Flp pilus assembly protein TadG
MIGTLIGRARRRARSEVGSATLELAILAPALLLILGLVIVAARVVATGSAVEQAAAAAAREASLSRDAREARGRAEQVASAALVDQGIVCQPMRSRIDTTGFAVAIGRPASVSVEVACTVPLGDLAVPGIPGSRLITADASSPLDSYRERR